MPSQTDGKRKPPTAAVNLIAGGSAGMMEALVCHPLGKFPQAQERPSGFGSPQVCNTRSRGRGTTGWLCDRGTQ
ncbi:hypothetical protein LLEC1_05640 [Akanthomyces lecanii]|uniref:Uncharacterized protein n=1 Tax=Cordyceps confragosa TaxID=2714763 RepID=A0A179IJ93_CORDF|nr:hypothetical protein LLEC1_05640 [Akanthomyces lecanii]